MPQLSRRSLFSGVPIFGAASAATTQGAVSQRYIDSGDDPLFMSAAKLARLIRAKQLSATEVVKLHIARIEAVSPKINAVVAMCFERALQEASDADDAQARGKQLGPLHGVPMTIKDSFDTEGVVSTAGTLGRKTFVPAKDATVVARARAAGAILLGKTNTPEFTLGIGPRGTDNLIYGLTRNPYHPDYQPGGSSGGSAANVAAGGASFDIGSDWYGSIRDPSHACGVAGLKPSQGLCPRTGHIIGYGGLFDSFQQVGPIARRVEDLALLLPILAGPDNWDAATVPVPVGDPAAIDVSRLRVAFYPTNGLNRPSDEMQALVKRCAALFEQAGCRVTEDMPPKMSELAGARGDFSGTTGGLLTRRLLEKSGTTQPYPHLPMGGQEKPSADLTRFAEELDAARSEQLAWFENYDVILCPASLRAALPLDRVVPPPQPPPGKDGKRPRSPYYLGVYNSNGWPAGVVRAGTSAEDPGMPLGVQVIGRPWRDDQVIAALAYIEHHTGGYQRPPL
ncbi:amidase [Povalibacter sp.]|uniref:amidase n=1 Tax=Povalibacter sp. TaxID=1962978 RepID=UPI002F426B52